MALSPEHLTRKEVALRLGISVHEVRRREYAGTLTPSGRDQRGWILYSEKDIENVPRMPPRKTHGTKYDVDEAARVYPLLKKGLPLVDIVLEASVHPDAVLVIADSYAKLSGCLFLSADIMRVLNAMPFDGTFPLTTAEDVVELLENAAEEAKCKSCKKKPRTHCVGCGAEVHAKRQRRGDGL